MPTSKYLIVRNVLGLISPASSAVIEKYSNVPPTCSTGKTNIQLAVSEDWCGEIQADMIERLALRFIDRHPEGQADRELISSDDERQAGI